MTPPAICILSSSDAATRQAASVCDILGKLFGLNDVVIRSGNVPADHLLKSASEELTRCALLYVVLGPSTPSTSILVAESPAPLLPLSHSDSSDPLHIALTIAKFCSLSCPELRTKVQTIVRQQRQNLLVQDAQLASRSPKYATAIAACHDGKRTITGDAVSIEGRLRGKVRDRYVLGNHKLALVTTDRQSGFDRQLAEIPFKGAVLNLTSAFWFKHTKSIIPNHLISTPHPYVSIVKECKPFPIEFVVRSYMTGSTSTSIWKNYQDGVRNYCGHDLPEGMIKNQKLAKNLLTPTTKEEEHDRPISSSEIAAENWMTQEDLDVCSKAALSIFALGQDIAAQNGLILVDTKYEFGKCVETGQIMLIDEVHTPDSSRYWLASTYEERMAEGKEPDNIDKEFLRLWFRDHCDPYKDEVLPKAPRDLVLELSRRYILLYEMITSRLFNFDGIQAGDEAITAAIQANV